MLNYLNKWFTALQRAVVSEKGRKFAFYNDMQHAIIILGFALPTGLLTWLWYNVHPSISIILVASGTYALYNAQVYYSKQYKN